MSCIIIFIIVIIQVVDLQNKHLEPHKKINTGYLIVYYNKYISDHKCTIIIIVACIYDLIIV